MKKNKYSKYFFPVLRTGLITAGIWGLVTLNLGYFVKLFFLYIFIAWIAIIIYERYIIENSEGSNKIQNLHSK